MEALLVRARGAGDADANGARHLDHGVPLGVRMSLVAARQIDSGMSRPHRRDIPGL